MIIVQILLWIIAVIAIAILSAKVERYKRRSANNYAIICNLEKELNEKPMPQDLYKHDWINIDGNDIHKTAIIHPNVKLGKGNVIGAYCVIGSNGEIRGVNQSDFKGTVEIGNNNVISEFVSIQRPLPEGEKTIIGNNNILMAHVHVGHDVRIYDDTEICTSTVLGGYCQVHFRAKIKLHCVIRNRIVIGADSIVGMGSVVTKNVDQKSVVYGNPAKEFKKKDS